MTTENNREARLAKARLKEHERLHASYDWLDWLVGVCVALWVLNMVLLSRGH